MPLRHGALQRKMRSGLIRAKKFAKGGRLTRANKEYKFFVVMKIKK
jgi:hypothetical protein